MTKTCTLRENVNGIAARFLRCDLAFAETILKDRLACDGPAKEDVKKADSPSKL